ncbi:MAG: hypothetical protein AAF791_12415 [Bacteroidota bacterium]
MGTFPHKKPLPRYHSERRAGAASRRLREALNGESGDPIALSPAALARQRDRRNAHAERHGRSDGRWTEALTVVALVLLILAILISTADKFL